jgi:hypothetical protein
MAKQDQDSERMCIILLIIDDFFFLPVTVSPTVTVEVIWPIKTDGIPTFVVWDRGRKPCTDSAPEDDLPMYHIPCT